MTNKQTKCGARTWVLDMPAWCSLPAGHAGWHTAGGTSWEPDPEKEREEQESEARGVEATMQAILELREG